MRPLHLLFAVLVAVLWGGNFIAAKYSVAYFPPFLVTALRFALVALMMVPFVPRPTLQQLRRLLPIAVMSTLHFSLLFVALHRQLDISTAALIGQLGVPFACLLGVIFLKDTLGPWRIGGIAISFAGMAVILGAPNISANPTAFFIGLASALTWGAANVLIKRVEDMGSMQMLAWVSVLIIPIALVLSLLFEPSLPPFLEAPPEALAGLLYTAFFSTVVAYGLWYMLLSRYTVSQVTPFQMLTPIFGIAFGKWFFAEQLTPELLWGGALTIIGVAVIVIRRPKTLPLGEAT